eukprot:scaffold10676_cov49-Cyclotella_meneghiniana.AAC.6
MIDKRSNGTRRSRITDDNVRDWVESEAFESRNAASMSILESKLNETSAVKDYPAHGNVEEVRPDGVFRGMSVQLNGMVTRKVMNRKARLLTAAIKKYEVQFVGIGEVGVNWKKANRKRLLSLLPELTGEARAMTANNTTENVAVHQQGGVATLALGEILNYYKKGSKDFRHLGRWTSFILQSVQGHRTRIVQAYGVRANRSNILGSVYQQHVRYIQQHLNENVSPRQLFESDLLWQLSVWRALGDRIILIMDINCHVLTGKLSRALTVEGIDLKEITKDHIGSLCLNTHSSGSEQIDGVWATPDITVTAVKWLPYSESPGDHRSCVFNFTTLSAIGTSERRIVLPACRRLVFSNPAAVDAYIAEMDRQFSIHRIHDRLDDIQKLSNGEFPMSDHCQELMDKLDAQVIEIQLHCESKCRHIYRPDSPYSPDISLWDKRGKMFKRMIDILDGTVRNPGVIRKQARKLGIAAPKMWTYDECVHGVQLCKAWKKKLSKYAPCLRIEHLQQRLLEAEATEDKERAKAIRTMMIREESSSMWSSLSYTFNDNGGRSNAVTRVERIENGVTVEYTEQTEVERVVREMTQNRFTLADSSPLCSGLLGEQLGYLANTEVAEQILTGNYMAPEEASNATVLVLEEISRIAEVMKAGKVSLSVSPEEFTQYWKKMKERTSSSYSKAHFGHYKVAAMYKQYAQFFATKLSIISQSGTPPSRWGIGMTVLLEKIAGLALVNKLRAILLFEADSNMFNRLIFGDPGSTI